MFERPFLTMQPENPENPGEEEFEININVDQGDTGTSSSVEEGGTPSQ